MVDRSAAWPASGFRPDNRQFDLTSFAAILAPQERLQVADEPMAGLAKALHGDDGGAPALAVDAHAICDCQVFDPGIKERAQCPISMQVVRFMGSGSV
jgi:hypothetical protein